MAETLNYAAVDLGAESGRVMLARFDGATLALEEAHRFPNVPVRVPTPSGETLHWDVLRLWGDIQHGLTAAGRLANGPLASIGVDTWGVDFGLLDGDGRLLANPVHYRDARTTGMVEAAFSRVPRREIFERTGIQFMPINTLYQLLALATQRAPELERASAFLTMPDLFNYWLTGEAVNEFSNATTTQCFNPRTGDWARDLLDRLGIPTGAFRQIIQPGTRLGALRGSLAGALGATPVIAPATHDTGSAVAATPLQTRDAIYLSSGTWSLMGVEADAPVIDARTLALNFTNEGGVGGTFRLLKNIMGLWIVQECRRAFAAAGQELSYAELTRLAEAAPAFGPIVDVTDARFAAPGGMPDKIRAYCRETSQPEPATVGEIVRCGLESLALEYRWVAERLSELTGLALPVIHIIGGGSQNALLNQLTADATGRRVVAGPVEATALGNVLVQALAAGQVASLSDGRALVARSFDTRDFTPRSDDRWAEAYGAYEKRRGPG